MEINDPREMFTKLETSQFIFKIKYVYWLSHLDVHYVLYFYTYLLYALQFTTNYVRQLYILNR